MWEQAATCFPLMRNDCFNSNEIKWHAVVTETPDPNENGTGPPRSQLWTHWSISVCFSGGRLDYEGCWMCLVRDDWLKWFIQSCLDSYPRSRTSWRRPEHSGQFYLPEPNRRVGRTGSASGWAGLLSPEHSGNGLYKGAKVQLLKQKSAMKCYVPHLHG